MKKPHPKSKENQLLEDYISSMLSSAEQEDRGAQTSDQQKTATTSEIEQPKTYKEEKKSSEHFVTNNATSDKKPITHAKKTTDAEPSIRPEFRVAPLPDEFLEHPPEIDPRLEQVQSLLAKIPAALKMAPEVGNQTELKTKPKPHVEKAELKPPTTYEVKPKVVIDLPTDEQASDNEQPIVGNHELLNEDVTREVTRAREMLGDAFQTLIFDVGKLPLAVPLVKLGGIHAYSEEDITPIFGTPDWFKGLIPSEHGNIMLVDTAKYIMPEKYDEIKDQLDYKYAILLDDTRWALACTHVREAKTLSIDDIRWAQKGTRKEWFAGMVVQFMCALLEVDSLINSLYRSGQKQKNR